MPLYEFEITDSKGREYHGTIECPDLATAVRLMGTVGDGRAVVLGEAPGPLAASPPEAPAPSSESIPPPDSGPLASLPSRVPTTAEPAVTDRQEEETPPPPPPLPDPSFPLLPGARPRVLRRRPTEYGLFHRERSRHRRPSDNPMEPVLQEIEVAEHKLQSPPGPDLLQEIPEEGKEGTGEPGGPRRATRRLEQFLKQRREKKPRAPSPADREAEAPVPESDPAEATPPSVQAPRPPPRRLRLPIKPAAAALGLLAFLVWFLPASTRPERTPVETVQIFHSRVAAGDLEGALAQIRGLDPGDRTRILPRLREVHSLFPEGNAFLEVLSAERTSRDQARVAVEEYFAARGDRRTGKLIIELYRQGKRWAIEAGASASLAREGAVPRERLKEFFDTPMQAALNVCYLSENEPEWARLEPHLLSLDRLGP